ncbi:hypothetical protein XENTR_v10019970 [Xenopus tropicalis]|nr:hypothetical protein XENTR_v10019970 [Xenopus tropicalis]
MHYKEVVRRWHEGVVAAEGKDYDAALRSFTAIEDPPSRIWFNVGGIYLLRGDLPRALEAYDKSLAQDPCLAVGYYQRGYLQFKLGRYEKALSDCHLALSNLRNNSFIDYKQLGLRHVLFSWEAQYNMAAVLCSLGRWESAEEKLKETLQGDGRNAKLDWALDQVQRRSLLQPMSVPEGEFFRPRKQEVEQLNSVDFLGKPTVISSVVPNDQYSGFEPLRPQQPGFYEPCRDAMQCREAGYHRVVVHYYPENSNEVAVKANSVLFVLNKDGDWATAIHDGQKILIPTSFLEPTNPPKADIKKMNNGIPLPPMKTPPTRPNVRPGMEPLTGVQAGAPVPPQPAGGAAEPYKIKALPVGMEPIVEVAVPVQRSVPTHKETGNVPLGNDASLVEDAGRTIIKPKGESAPEPGPFPTRQTGPDNGPMATPVPTDDDKLVLSVHAEFTVNMTVSKAITYPELQGALREELRKHGEQMANHLRFVCIQFPSFFLYPFASDWFILLNCRIQSAVAKSTEGQVQGLKGKYCFYNSSLAAPESLLEASVGFWLKLDVFIFSYRDPESRGLTPVTGSKDWQEVLKLSRANQVTLCCKETTLCAGRPVLYRMRAQYDYLAQGPADLSFQQGDLISILSEVNGEWLEGHCHRGIGIFPKCFAQRAEGI